jgi:glutaconate CoA-transferase subunit B
MACVMARLLRGLRHVAVGALSPLPASAALLAQALEPGLQVTILGSRKHLRFTDGGRELFDCAAQGRIVDPVIRHAEGDVGADCVGGA